MKNILLQLISVCLLSSLLAGCNINTSGENEILIGNVSLEQMHTLGGLFAWRNPNSLYFNYSPHTAEGVVAYDFETGGTKKITLPNLDPFPFVSIDQSGSMIGFSNQNNRITIYDLLEEKSVLEVEGRLMCFSPNANRIAIWRLDKLFLIDLTTRSEELIFELDSKLRLEEKKFVRHVEWRPGTNQIAFMLHYYDRPTTEIVTDDVFLLDLETKEVSLLDSAEMNFSGLSWSPDGRLLAYSYGGYDDPTRLRIMDVQNSCRIDDIPATWPTVAFWSPDGKKILYGYEMNVGILNIQEYFGVGYGNLSCDE